MRALTTGTLLRTVGGFFVGARVRSSVPMTCRMLSADAGEAASAAAVRTVCSSPLWRTQAFVGGAWIDADDGATFDVLDPATGHTLCAVPDMGAAEATRAVDAAAAALPAWRAALPRERAAVLRAWYDAIVAETEMLATVMTLECGKPLAEARGEIAYAASFVKFYAEEATRVSGEVLSPNAPGRRLLVLKQPVGVCALITPWNFPAAMITRKAAPALAAGCTAVIKPGEDTPLTALVLAALAERAGVPEGVLSVVTASRGAAPAVGAALCDSKLVRKVVSEGAAREGEREGGRGGDGMEGEWGRESWRGGE